MRETSRIRLLNWLLKKLHLLMFIDCLYVNVCLILRPYCSVSHLFIELFGLLRIFCNKVNVSIDDMQSSAINVTPHVTSGDIAPFTFLRYWAFYIVFLFIMLNKFWPLNFHKITNIASNLFKFSAHFVNRICNKKCT